MSALIYCPFPDRECARAIAGQLLDEKLIACANLLGQVEAIFEWDGERGTGRELGVLLKTDASILAKAVERLEALHPYDTPAILGWECDAAANGTAEWLARLRQ